MEGLNIKLMGLPYAILSLFCEFCNSNSLNMLYMKIIIEKFQWT